MPELPSLEAAAWVDGRADAIVPASSDVSNPMTIRTSRKAVTFCKPFSLDGVDRVLPAGTYEVVTDEELIEGLSFPVYRRIATMMIVPAQASSVEMINVDPLDLAAAKDRDAQMVPSTGAPEKA
jgi:hypothetical protein